MLYVISGKDEYSKKQYISQISKKKPTDLPEGTDLLQYTQSGLFGGAESYLIHTGDWFKDDTILQTLANSDNNFIFIEPSGFRAKVMWPERTQVQKFDLPKIADLPSWIQKYTTTHGGKVDASTSKHIATLLFGQPASFAEGEVDLLLLSSELDKLLMASEGVITQELVTELVSPAYDPTVFQMMELLFLNKKRDFFSLFKVYFSNISTTDETGRLISFVAFLSEQLRSMLLVKSGLSDQEILDVSKWKSGRLFMVKKQAARFEKNNIIAILKKLEALDEEIKTGHPAPLSILTLILTQI